MFAAFHDAEHCSSRVFKRKNQLFKTCLRSHRNVYPTVLFNVKTKCNEPLHYQQFIDLPRNGFVAHLKFSSNHGRGCLKGLLEIFENRVVSCFVPAKEDHYHHGGGLLL